MHPEHDELGDDFPMRQEAGKAIDHVEEVLAAKVSNEIAIMANSEERGRDDPKHSEDHNV